MEKQKRMPVNIMSIASYLINLINLGWEEYYDYIFPGDETGKKGIQLLQRAYLWKEAKKAE